MNNKLKLLTIVLCLSSSTWAQSYQTKMDVEGLAVGDKVENFIASDAEDKVFKLSEALEEGPVVLIFYRGHWCPYCNQHLALVQDSLQLIQELGAQVIAVSPQKPDYINKTEKKSGARFTLLYDENYTIAEAFGLDYVPPANKLVTYNLFNNAELKEAHSDESQRLPIPATYVINQDNQVTWRHFDPNYKKRSSVGEIMLALSRIY